MERTERFYKIEKLLRSRTAGVPMAEFLDVLQVSRATLKRDLEYLRDRMQAPIRWNASLRGYELDPNAPMFELPGLWFSPAEAYALVTMQNLLENLQPGLLTPHVRPLLSRIEALLGRGARSRDEVQKRVRVLHQAARSVRLEAFQEAASAVLQRKRLDIRHFNRQRNEETCRVISPQRLVHYRGNWYVDAWCHTAGAVRSFALDAVRAAQLLDEVAREVAESDLDALFTAGYGIFSGANVLWARLRFTPERARWVASEVWHADQRSVLEPDGAYVLEVPYSDDRELLMDILKYGPDVEVLAPATLRRKVAGALRAAAKRY
jgi:predicted DNA-binding transcriptional regulator YafY